MCFFELPDSHLVTHFQINFNLVSTRFQTGFKLMVDLCETGAISVLYHTALLYTSSKIAAGKKEKVDMAKAGQPYKRTSDILFHRMIGNNSYPEITAGFIRDMLGIEAESVQVLNPYSLDWFEAEFDNLTHSETAEYAPSSESFLGTTVDVLVEINGGERIIVECQRRDQSYFRERIFFYAATRYSELYSSPANRNSISNSSDSRYSSLSFLHSIVVTDFNMFATDDAPLHHFMLYDVDNKVFYYPAKTEAGLAGPVSLTFLELTKPLELASPSVSNWMKLLKNAGLPESAPEYIKKAEWLANEQSMSRKEREMIKQIRNAREEYEAAIEFATISGIEQGLEQGRVQGIEQGIEQGRVQNQVENAQAALAKGLSPEDIAEITGLDLSVVLGLRDEQERA